jgi:hypothetical protein
MKMHLAHHKSPAFIRSSPCTHDDGTTRRHAHGCARGRVHGLTARHSSHERCPLQKRLIRPTSHQ